jgi:hypothetical protein
MPETFGKRQRRAVKERKAAAREERRVARNQRRDDRAAGVLEPGPPVQPNEMDDFGLPEPEQAES